MSIPEFHQWLEGLTKQLQDDPVVQDRAYFRKDSSPSEDFKEHAVRSVWRGGWFVPCVKCGLDSIVEVHPADFVLASHYCQICRP